MMWKRWCKCPAGSMTPAARGFTLLEALIAIAIAALALGALARAVGQGGRVAVVVAERQQAAMVARAVLAMGTFAEDYVALTEGHAPPWSWRVSVQPQSARLVDVAGVQPEQTLVAARLTVEVRHQDAADSVYVLTAWKPYRAAP